jgi:hypothetical protein
MFLAWTLLERHSLTEQAVEGSPLLTYRLCTSTNKTLWDNAAFLFSLALLSGCLFFTARARAVPQKFNQSQDVALVVYNLVLCAAAAALLEHLLRDEPVTRFYSRTLFSLWVAAASPCGILGVRLLRARHEARAHAQPPPAQPLPLPLPLPFPLATLRVPAAFTLRASLTGALPPLGLLMLDRAGAGAAAPLSAVAEAPDEVG